MVGLIRSLTLAGLVAACNSPDVPPTTELSSGEVLAVIREKGPDSALRRFVLADSTFGDDVLLGISSGDSAWLDVARLLKPVADAGASTFLSIAVADALPAAPERVLALVGPDYPAEQVCGLPFIEQPDSEAVAYYRRARPAVERVDRLALAPQRAACLEALGRARPSGVAPAG